MNIKKNTIYINKRNNLFYKNIIINKWFNKTSNISGKLLSMKNILYGSNFDINI